MLYSLHSKYEKKMTIWPLYTHAHVVVCDMCEEEIASARLGECTEFGDGNGNYVLRCGCGWSVSYDLTRSKAKADAHKAEHAELFASCRMINIKAFAKQKREYFISLLAKITGGGSAFKMSATKKSVAKKSAGAFSTAGLITEEARKVTRK
jgi:hypothetical protein